VVLHPGNRGDRAVEQITLLIDPAFEFQAGSRDTEQVVGKPCVTLTSWRGPLGDPAVLRARR
jgi:hypothetical protein